jgi:hypothetical protein
MAESKEGIAFFTREYESKLILVAAEEAGFPVVFQADQIKKLAVALATKGLYIVKPVGPNTNVKVERVVEGKDAAQMVYIHKE